MSTTKMLLGITLLLVIILSGCSSNPAGLAGGQSSPLVLGKEQSFFHEFTVQKDKVYIRCELTIHNTGDSPVSFCIKGDFTEDKQGGLLSNSELYAYQHESGEKVFTVDSNGSLENIMVDFIGDYGGTNEKQDRLLPDKIAFEIENAK